MPIADGRADKDLRAAAQRTDIKDQFAYRYPLVECDALPVTRIRPHRFEPFFTKMYGRLAARWVAKRLKPLVACCPSAAAARERPTSTMSMSARRGGEGARHAVARHDKFLVPSAGTSICRTILNTSRLSVLRSQPRSNIMTSNHIGKPEKPHTAHSRAQSRAGRHRRDFRGHGFIGRQMFHVDSMHFEYRPETHHAGEAKAGQRKSHRQNRIKIGGMILKGLPSRT